MGNNVENTANELVKKLQNYHRPLRKRKINTNV